MRAIRIPAAAAALLLAAALCGCSPRSERAPAAGGGTAGDRTPEPSLFELAFPFTDADGRTRTLQEFRGQPFVASMMYTNCTSVCPRVTADLKSLDKALPPDVRRRTRFLLFSLDPGRDTPAALAKFAEQHALDRSRWTLLASSEDDMRTLAAVMGVKFRPDQGGEIAHSAVVIVCDSAGVVRHRQVGIQDSVRPLVEAVRGVMR